MLTVKQKIQSSAQQGQRQETQGLLLTKRQGLVENQCHTRRISRSLANVKATDTTQQVE